MAQGRGRRPWAWLGALALAASPAPAGAGEGGPVRGPDVVRATVQIRKGPHRGSGTVVASDPGETLVLTAAHVVAGPGAVKVELHRHNLGFRSSTLTEGGGWPRLVAGEVAAADPGADLALVRVRGMVALPFVARFDPSAGEPEPGEVMTSVGVDRTLHLTGWTTAVTGSAEVALVRGVRPRRFTLTARAPEHGRSGGGLFRADGTIAGVCTGQITAPAGPPRAGIFASVDGIRRLLDTPAFRAATAPRPRKPTG